jgi:hypothetical protein
MSFEREDNWDDAPGYRRAGIVWRARESNPEHVVYESEQDSECWAIRLNDFPDEPCFTLIVDGREIIHFNDWPAEWGNPPEL